MTNEGNHGGNTRDETHTPLILISTNPNHEILPKSQKTQKPQKTCLQIDFTPTISSLFHFSIPSQSQGILLPEILDRFNESKAIQLCTAFQNAIQIQKVITEHSKLKNLPDFQQTLKQLQQILDSSLNFHLEFTKNTQNFDIFERTKQSYQEFLSKMQQRFVKDIETDNSYFLALILILALNFIIIFALFWAESKNKNSIFSVTFKPKIFQSKQIENNNNFFTSQNSKLLILAIIILNMIAMTSTNFIQAEHLFWNFLVGFILIIKVWVLIK